MSSVIEVKYPSDEEPGKIIKWRVSPDTMVSAGRILLLYQTVGSNEKKLRATQFGRVNRIMVKAGETIVPGQVLVQMIGCKHPTVMKDLCAECGADLREEALANGSEASVPMVHSIPELKVCPELAEKIGKADEQRLLNDRKLALLVDLDQTIVHTTNDNVPAVMKDVFHYTLYGPNSPWYHTRLRPGTRHFLAEMSKLYELHICTFGARNYAHTVAKLLDKEGDLFSHRILSRDECFNPASKTANLKALFPCGDDLVAIIDDREDVWQGCGNLVQVKPYHYFKHTGDIHAPPGLEKRDLPDVENSVESVDRGDNVVEDGDIAENENGIVEEKSDVNSITDNDKPELPQMTPEESKKPEAPSEQAAPEAPPDKNAQQISEKKSTDDTSMENEEDLSISKKEHDEHDDDHDDYLLYLEDILRRIHSEFYEHMQKGERKALREIIPRVKRHVLQGLCLTFSGLIPTQHKLEDSRAYRVAKAFGAEVEQDLTEKTTHLVAIKPGTAKVYAAKKNSKIKIVNPDWLWSCAERWERVDERLFPLTAKARGSRIPPPHCSSPDRIELDNPATDTFANTINPLMSFTKEEIERMDKEVDEDMTDPEMDSSIFDVEDLGVKRVLNESDESEEEYESRKRRKTQDNSSSSSLEEKAKYYEDNDEDDEDEDPVTRFRRGEGLPSDLELGDSQDSPDEIDDPVEDDDDREWNAMGAALEREFLTE